MTIINIIVEATDKYTEIRIANSIGSDPNPLEEEITKRLIEDLDGLLRSRKPSDIKYRTNA
jgi:hypothetical protein